MKARKIIALLGLVALVSSCKKDEIEVVKNLDTSYTIDKNLVDDDIRTKLGYDPRFYYAGFSSQEINMAVLRIGSYQLERQAQANVVVVFDKAVEKETTIEVVYDAAVFDKVKDNYTGYSLGNQSLINFTKTEVVIPKGEGVASFEFKAENLGTDKLLVPFSFKIKNNDEAKIDEAKSYFVAKIYPQTVTFGVEQRYEQNIIYFDETGITKKENPVIKLDITASHKVSADIKLGLVRDNSLLTYGNTLAPASVEGTIEKIAFKDVLSGTFSITLQDVTYTYTQTTYPTIPLKVVVYDADGNAHPTEDFILASYTAYYEGIKPLNSSDADYADIEYMNKISASEVHFDSFGLANVSDSAKMLDGNDSTFAYFRSNRSANNMLTFNFDTKKRIKAIRITMTSTHSMEQVRLHTSDAIDASGLESKGTFRFSFGESGYALVFKEPIEVHWIVLDAFYRSQGEWFQIEEIEFFEE